MITKTNDLLGTLIHDVAYLLRHEIDDRLRPYNLTRVKWLALGVIDDDGPLSQSELAATLELGPASVGRLVDRLVQRGFVNRTQDTEDRRSYKLSTTDAAKALIDELEDLRDEFDEDTLNVLNEAEISTLKTSLAKLKARLTSGAVQAGLVACVTFHKAIPTAHLWSDALTLV